MMTMEVVMTMEDETTTTVRLKKVVQIKTVGFFLSCPQAMELGERSTSSPIEIVVLTRITGSMLMDK